MDSGLQTIKLSELPEAIALNESDYSLIVQNGTSKKIKGLLLKGNVGDKGEKGEQGDKGDKGDKGTDAINPTFTIGTVTTLPSGSDATVTLTGNYPNLVLNFGIPRGADGSGGGTEEPEDTTPYMYYGRLSIQEVGGKVIQYNEITEDMIKSGAAITATEPQTLNKVSMGLTSHTAMGDYVVVAVPSSRNYTVKQDNGFGGKAPFDEETAGANGIDININGIPYKLYGQILISQGEIFVYVE